MEVKLKDENNKLYKILGIVSSGKNHLPTYFYIYDLITGKISEVNNKKLMEKYKVAIDD